VEKSWCKFLIYFFLFLFKYLQTLWPQDWSKNKYKKDLEWAFSTILAKSLPLNLQKVSSAF
jgi:hypothetical protein